MHLDIFEQPCILKGTMEKLSIITDFIPAGDQPQAIDQLTQGLQDGKEHQVLLGVTGSGKTFTIANVIERAQRPALIIAHNKTLAAQLYEEFKGLFPKNAVEYFVSYYDYYQPEAYLPVTDTYIEKDSAINEEIDKLRHAATHSLLTRARCNYHCKCFLYLWFGLAGSLFRDDGSTGSGQGNSP